MTLATDSRAYQDVRALAQIAETVWDELGKVKGLPANAQGSLAASILDVVGQAYMEDRGRYIQSRQATGQT